MLVREPHKAPSKSPAAPPTKARPQFATEAAERAYWTERDAANYVDWSQAKRVRLPNLKTS